MQNRNYLAAIAIVLLALGFLGLCISISVLIGVPILFGAREELSEITSDLTLPVGKTSPSFSTTPSPIPLSSQVEAGNSTPGTTITVVSPTEMTISESSTLTLEPTENQNLGGGWTYAPSSTIGSLAMDSWCVPWNTESTKARVHEVIDGVSIEAVIDGDVKTVRYIGVQIPDYSQDPDIWARARDKNRELVEGKDILLIRDRSDVDSEGRLLRYVLAGSVFVNRRMLESGYSVAFSAPPDISCSPIFEEAERLARSIGRGIWAPTSTPSRGIPTRTSTPARTGDVVIVKIEPEGTIWQEPEEFVEIFNDGSQSVQLRDWTIEDAKGHVFVFPNFVLGSQQYCRVYTNLYIPEHCGFSYYSLSPIWDNDGDCAYLKDGDGTLIDKYCYE